MINTIQNARAHSTARLYSNKWSAFVRWCEERDFPPECCSVEVILEFLQHLLDLESGLAASTIKVYASAISACHEGFARTTVFTHPLVRSFLAGVRRLRPVTRATAPQWDLPLVLNALCGAPFEPLEGASLKWLSVKTALLLALATGKRVSDLRALSIQPGCLVISGDASKAVLRPNPAFVPKVVQSAFAARPVELSAFFPPPHANGEEERLHALCPVRVLAEYIRRTAGTRATSQLLVCYGPGKVGSPLSKQRLPTGCVRASPTPMRQRDALHRAL